MSKQEQLRARTLAFFHSLVSNWANELRKEMTIIQDGVIRQLDAVQERVSQYEENLDEGAILSFVDELSRSFSGGGREAGLLPQVRASMTELERGNSLTEILTQLVTETARIAPRSAMFILKGGNCVGWYAEGFDQSPGFSNEAVKKISVPSSADTVFRAVISSRQSFVGESGAHRDNVQLLSRIGNVLPSGIFAMPLILRDKIAAVLYADSGDAREGIEGTEAIEILVSYACKIIDLQSAAKSVGKSTAEVRAEKVREIQPPAPAPAPAPVHEEGATVMFRQSPSPAPAPAAARPAAAAAPGPARPAPAAPAAPAGPMDLETRKQHEDAKRFARLLVSEIKLYREAEVQQGRKNRDLYERLKDDIDRSRQLYLERVPAEVRTQSNYFNEELVRILADGDAGALGHAL
jgi:hypothetical protein